MLILRRVEDTMYKTRSITADNVIIVDMRQKRLTPATGGQSSYDYSIVHMMIRCVIP